LRTNLRTKQIEHANGSQKSEQSTPQARTSEQILSHRQLSTEEAGSCTRTSQREMKANPPSWERRKIARKKTQIGGSESKAGRCYPRSTTRGNQVPVLFENGTDQERKPADLGRTEHERPQIWETTSWQRDRETPRRTNRAAKEPRRRYSPPRKTSEVTESNFPCTHAPRDEKPVSGDNRRVERRKR
jgi:hypothetical protein